MEVTAYHRYPVVAGKLVQRAPLRRGISISGGNMESIIEFLDLFIDVFFYPLDPLNLVLEDNPLVLICLVVLIGMSIIGLFRRCYVKLLSGR